VIIKTIPNSIVDNKTIILNCKIWKK